MNRIRTRGTTTVTQTFPDCSQYFPLYFGKVNALRNSYIVAFVCSGDRAKSRSKTRVIRWIDV